MTSSKPRPNPELTAAKLVLESMKLDRDNVKKRGAGFPLAFGSERTHSPHQKKILEESHQYYLEEHQRNLATCDARIALQKVKVEALAQHT